MTAGDDNDIKNINNNNKSNDKDYSTMSLHDNNHIINTNINPSKLYLTTNQHQESLQSIVSLKDYLHILNRHKSIDNCFLLPSAIVDDSTNTCYYDDEIKKLTNHLFNITKNHYSEIEIPKTTETATSTNPKDQIENKNHNYGNNDDRNLYITSNSIVDDNNNKIDDKQMDQTQETSTDAMKNNQFSEIFKKFSKLADSGSIVSNVPWAVTKRTKFRINQTSSRDVPIVKTDKPAKLRKQNAIDDSTDMKLFDESINHTTRTDAADILTAGTNIVDFLHEKFSNKRHHHIFQSMRHETFVGRLTNGSISFDCGQLGEQRSINTFKALFQLHATTGTSVKEMQALIESKRGD